MIIGRSIEDLTYDLILKEIENQAKTGISYFTIHAGVKKIAPSLREKSPDRHRLARRIAAGEVDAPPQRENSDERDLRRHLRHHARVRCLILPLATVSVPVSG
jgi:hypothetical protein